MVSVRDVEDLISSPIATVSYNEEHSLSVSAPIR